MITELDSVSGNHLEPTAQQSVLDTQSIDDNWPLRGSGVNTVLQSRPFQCSTRLYFDSEIPTAQQSVLETQDTDSRPPVPPGLDTGVQVLAGGSVVVAELGSDTRNMTASTTAPASAALVANTPRPLINPDARCIPPPPIPL